MDEILFRRMEEAEGVKVSYDEDFNYYTSTVMGYRLMYRTDRFRPDGQKMFQMNDELAKLIGFANAKEMRQRIRGVQWWRGFLTLKAIKRRLR